MGRNGKTGTYVALFRGINVGGKNVLPMKDLVGLFKKTRCEKVETYIQSGNVLFQAERELARRIPWLISRSIQRSFNFEISLVVRSAAEMIKIARGNPFLNQAKSLERLHVAFLSSYPTKGLAASLDPKHSPLDEYHLVGSEIYLFCPQGMARTKLTNAYFDSKLACVSTFRNWKTVLKLRDLAVGR